MRRLIAFMLTVAGLVSVSHTADAKRSRSESAKRAPAQFLGLKPHGPLARVEGGVVVEPEGPACRTWHRDGREWKALDAFGRLVGTARVSGAERYDVTSCDELTLERVSGRRGVGVFARGSYQPLAIDPWKPSVTARRRLEELVAARDARLPKARSKKDVALSRRMLAYRVKGRAPRVVVGGRAISVYRFERGSWIVEREELPCEASDLRKQSCRDTVWDPEMYRPIAVLDMNGDGRPEVVVHEAFLDSYADFTLTETMSGVWKRIEAGIHGAFA
ncbi:MAG: hypothetical protein JNK04_20105 [Myxococcales bacterium]|nr:hypothetical protein [Myxococcales bacterium]